MKNTIVNFKHLIGVLSILMLSFQAANSQNSIEPTKVQQDALDRLYAPHREKVIEILTQDKTGQYERYQADLEAADKETELNRKKEMLESLRRNHYNFIKKAYQGAKINLVELKVKVADILRHNKFSLDEFGGIRIEIAAPNLTPALRFDATFLCPLGSKEEFTNSSAVGVCDGFINDCKVSLSSYAEIVGGCRSKGFIGEDFNLSQGTFQKINVSAKFDLKYYGFAMAIAGYSQANSKVGVRLKGPGFDQVIIVKESVCIAPIIWFNSYEVNAPNFLVQADFTGTFNGNNEFTAQAYFETFAIGVLPSGAYADNQGEFFDFVKVAAQ